MSKRKLLVTVPFVLILLLSALQNLGRNPNFAFFGITTVWAADSFDNDIRNLFVEQYNGSAWITIRNYTASGYTPYERIFDNQTMNFTVQVLANNTLFATEADCNNFVTIYVNITYGVGWSDYVTGWQQTELNNATSTVAYADGTHWLITRCGNWTSYLPTAGFYYNMTVEAKFYY